MKPSLMKPRHCYIGRDFALTHIIVKPTSVNNVTIPETGHVRTDIKANPVFMRFFDGSVGTDDHTWFWDEQEVDELTPEEYQQFIDAWTNYRNSFRDLATKFNRRHNIDHIKEYANPHGLPPHLLQKQ